MACISLLKENPKENIIDQLIFIPYAANQFFCLFSSFFFFNMVLMLLVVSVKKGQDMRPEEHFRIELGICLNSEMC